MNVNKPTSFFWKENKIKQVLIIFEKMEAKVEPRETYTKIDKKLHRAVARFEKDVGKITSKTPTKVSLNLRYFCKLLKY